uniref:hypothetical protein n=1 Tax=Saccharothrix espanaensis TaxID=103731 RepID=UPI003F49AF24
MTELHHAIMRAHREQSDARRLPWWFDHAATYGRLLPLGHYALVVFHLDLTLAQRRWIEDRWKAARHGSSAVAVWTPPASRAQAERDEQRGRQQTEVHRLLRQVLLTEQPCPEVTYGPTTNLREALESYNRVLIAYGKQPQDTVLTLHTPYRGPRQGNPSRLKANYRLWRTDMPLIYTADDAQVATGEPADKPVTKRRRVRSVTPCVPTADRDLRAGDPREFAMLLDTIRVNAGITASRLATLATVPRNSVYLMLNPDRGVLPTKADSVRNVAVACGLPHDQVEKVMMIWFTLRNDLGPASADEPAA